MALEMRHCFLVVVIWTLLAACGTFPATALAEAVVKIGGTGSAMGAMKQLAVEYEKSYPGTKIQVLPSLGSSGGIKAVLGNGIDLAVASRPLTESEQQQGAVAMEYAKSPFVFVTNPKVKKNDISGRELEAFYNNATSNWPDGSRIRLILRPENDSDSRLLSSISPAMEQAVKAALSRPGMIMAITDQESSEAIARTPGALGGATLTEIISEKLPLNVLSFNGVQPSTKTISNGTYPLVKSLYLVTAPNPSAEARKFIVFVRSLTGRKILTKTGNLVVELK